MSILPLQTVISNEGDPIVPCDDVVQIDIFSDVICPWCLIGKRRLEQALRDTPNTKIRLVWRAFELNPGMPAQGMDRRTYLATKFLDKANAVYDHIAQIMASEGIPARLDAITRTPNTLNSHRLLAWIAAKFDTELSYPSLQTQMIEALFQAYFVEGRDIGILETLIEIAVETGLQAAEIRAFLNSDDKVEAIRREQAYAREIGIQGVPGFLFNGKMLLCGAQPPDSLVKMIALAQTNNL